jgi:DNA-binding winged helix-turn-helix (wHTH) protein
VIEIGGYTLDANEMTLSRKGSSVKLEPKVLEVLSYFCENENRYISMSELHENVWKDRCVSDAAVRRAIGKLRQLFNDDHKDPSFIQSLPKRGYKLICQVSHVTNDHEISVSIPISSSLSTSQVNNTEYDIVTKLINGQNKTIFFLVIFIILLFFILPIVYGVYENIVVAEASGQINSDISNIERPIHKYS